MVTYFTCVFYIYFKPHSTLFGHYFYYSLFFLKSPFSFVYPHLFFMMIFILTCLSFYLGLFSFSWRTLIYFSARSAVNILSFCFLKPPSAFISFYNTYFELNSQTIYRPFTQSVQFNMPLILKDMFAETFKISLLNFCGRVSHLSFCCSLAGNVFFALSLLRFFIFAFWCLTT